MAKPALADYQLGGVVGHGLAGVVFEGTYRPSGRAVNLEKIPAEIAVRPGFQQRLALAGAKMSGVENRHLVAVHDLTSSPDGTLYLITEPPRGPSLDRLFSPSQPLTAPDAVAIGVDLCSALKACHAAGAVHGAISPQTVVVTPAGEARLTGLVLGFALASSASPGDDVSAVATLFQGLLNAADVGSVPPGLASVSRRREGHPGDAGALADALNDAAMGAWGPGWRRQCRLGERAAGSTPTPPVATLRQPIPASPPAPALTPTTSAVAAAPKEQLPELPPPPKSRRGKKPLLALALLVLLIGIGAGIFFATRPANVPPANPNAPLRVSNVTVNVSPATGGCDTTYTFEATGSVSGSGKLTFQWDRSDGQTVPAQTVNVDGNKDASFRFDAGWRLQGAQPSGSMTFRLLQPISVAKSASMVYRCP